MFDWSREKKSSCRVSYKLRLIGLVVHLLCEKSTDHACIFGLSVLLYIQHVMQNGVFVLTF